MQPFIPIFLVLLFAVMFAVANVAVSHLLGPRRSSPWKWIPYECGVVPRGDARTRISIHFYLIAILFIIFDIEIVFLFPWAVIFKDLGLFGFIEMMIFILILLLGLIYVWRRGALEWE